MIDAQPEKLVVTQEARETTYAILATIHPSRPLQWAADIQSIIQRAMNQSAEAAAGRALECLREPTPEMLAAGMDAADDALDSDWSSDADGNGYEYRYLRSDAPASIWRAMIELAIRSLDPAAIAGEEKVGKGPGHG